MSKTNALTILISALLIMGLLILPQPTRAASTWYIGNGGDFTNIMNAISSNQINDGDILYLISDITDEFYGGAIDKSVTIVGNGYKWTVYRYALPNQLEIIDTNVSLHNITIEFTGIYSKHLFALKGREASLYLYNVILNISEGGGFENVVSDVIYTSETTNSTLYIRNVTVIMASKINLYHLLRTDIKSTDLKIDIKNIDVNPIKELMRIRSENSNIYVNVRGITTSPNIPLINTTIIDTRIEVYATGLRYINGETSGININSTGPNHIHLSLTDIEVINAQDKFIHISNYSLTTTNISVVNAYIYGSNLINKTIIAEKAKIDINLQDIIFDNSQETIVLELYKSNSTLSLLNLRWINIVPYIKLILDNSSLDSELNSLVIPDNVDTLLVISASKSILNNIITNIDINGFSKRAIEITLKNTSTNLLLSNISADKFVQTGFSIISRDSNGSIHLENITIPIVNRRIGTITLVNSDVQVDMINIGYSTSYLDGLYIFGDDKSKINLLNINLSKCGGWSLYIQGGEIYIRNSNLAKIYVTSATIILENSTFDEVNSLIFFSNITVRYILEGRLLSSVTKEPLHNVKVAIYDKYGNKLGEGLSDNTGSFHINLEYIINDTYTAYPLVIEFSSQHYNWRIETGNYTIRHVKQNKPLLIHIFRIYKYSIPRMNPVLTIYIESDLNTVYLNMANESYSGTIIQLNQKILYIYFEIDNKQLVIIYSIDDKYGIVYYFKPYPIHLAYIGL